MSGLSIRQRLALELHRQLLKEQVQAHPLRQLFWECTLRCNMKCRHCGSDCKVSSLHRDMPFEDFRKVLERVRESYDPHRIMIILTGGEPLVREDIVRCGRAIYDMEFPWGMVTNGRLLGRKKLDELLGAGLHSITVSLDGFEKEHEWMRGVPGGFRYANEAVKMLAREDSIKFDVVTCVNNMNYGSLEDFKKYLVSIGVKHWRLFTVFPVGRAAENTMLRLDSIHFRGLMDFIMKTRKEGLIDASYGCEGFLGEYEGEVRDSLFACLAGINIASVLVDGSISSCPSIRADYHQGNIYSDDFVEVWEKSFAPYRNRSWMKKGECADCRYFRYCNGNGMHLRDRNGNLILCHLKRLSTFLPAALNR